MVTSDGNKRKADDDGVAAEDDGQQIKRAKLAVGTSKPALDMSILEKAKKALEKQKELKLKLQRLKETSSAKPPTAAPTVNFTTRLPPPLVLDDQGREVGASAEPHLSQQQQQQLPPKENPLLAPVVEDELQLAQDAHFDPFLSSQGGRGGQSRRGRQALRFVEEGRFQKQADEVRLRAQFGDSYIKELEERRRREREESAAFAGMDPNMIPLGTRLPFPSATAQQAAEEEEQAANAVPDVEWWDARILKDKTTYGGGDGDTALMMIKEDRITHYVEHPVLLDPPAEAPPPPPQPLKLTKLELKKLRSQRRMAREQEKQELIRQGLLEPPKPKVKISNLMAVLGAEATADPTAIEAEVRRQMAERAAAHDDRNLARMLTPAERRQKKCDKLILDKGGVEGGAAPVTQVAVYKVGDLSIPQLKFKVEMNAKENYLTGAAVCVPSEFCVVVVEGGPKTLRRYEKLMLQRIDWKNTGKDDDEDGDDEDDGDESGSNGGKPVNYCQLVWTGIAKSPAFRGKFKTEVVRNQEVGRRLFEERGVAHYWDLAAAFE